VTARWGCWASLALAAIAACAHVEPPPGGPEDKTPPEVASTDPESLTVAPSRTEPVVIRFSERISEQGAVEAVSVSPRTSVVQIDRGREGIRVSLRGGWRPNTIYHVTVTPEVRDLFNNRLAAPVTLVFSTGPPIPATIVTGTVEDRITGRPGVDTRVEAVRRADSLVYSTPTDSAGIFHIAHVPTGSYLLRAYRDTNRNRALDSYEARDSALVEVGTENSGSVALSIVDPDSTAPKLAGATAPTPVRVELRFDDYLDPAQELNAGMVQIADSLGVYVTVDSVSLTRPVESAAGAPGANAPAGGRQPAAPVGGAAARPAAPVPSQMLYVKVAAARPLAGGQKYKVTVRGVRNIVGLVGESEAELVVPAARPAPAPQAAPADPAAPAP
jgi:hypothetical protein